MTNDYEKVIGRNRVREALKSGRNINKIYIAGGETDHSLGLIAKQAREQGVFVQRTDRRKLDFMTAGASHQGVVALCSPIAFCTLDDILAEAKKRNEKPFIVMLDEVTDPHNAGAVIRSAYCAGAHGVVIGKRRSASIGEGVYKTSAGSVEYIKICQAANLAQAVEELKKKGVFAVCCDMAGDRYDKIDYDMPLLLVVGSEGEGVGRLIKSKCDFSAAIPMTGKINSLNASVAAGIIIFEARKQRSDQ
jgi:23S rRNA (guanosine2251-2'-O)-methyltransferase